MAGSLRYVAGASSHRKSAANSKIFRLIDNLASLGAILLLLSIAQTQLETISIGLLIIMADNHEEFVLLMTRHQRKIWWFINSLLPAPNAADDVLQETSLVMWRKWDRFDHDRAFLPWACGIARLQVFKFVRENRAKRQFLDEAVMGELADVAEKRIHHLARVETRVATLKACIKELEDEDRKIVEARYLKSLSAKQIADQGAKPTVTVYKILARARVKLMNCVKRKIARLEPN